MSIAIEGTVSPLLTGPSHRLGGPAAPVAAPVNTSDLIYDLQNLPPAVAQRLPIPSPAPINPPPSPLQNVSQRPNSTMQKIFLVAAAVGGILSIIPPLRIGASLALRSVAFLAASHAALDKTGSVTNKERLLQIAKISVVALGLIGVAASMPMLLVASLAADMACQIIDAVNAIRNGEGAKAFFHIAVLIIDTLALAGILTGSWQLMVAAASVSIAVMLILCCTACKAGDPISAISFFVLAGVSFAAAIKTSEISRNHFIKFKNETDHDMMYKWKDAWYILKPGEEVTLNRTSIFVCDLLQYGEYRGIPQYQTTVGREIFPPMFERAVQYALPPSLLPTVPVISNYAAAAVENVPLEEDY